MGRLWGTVIVVLLTFVMIKWLRALRRVPPPPEPFRIPAPDPDGFAVRGFDLYVRLDPARRLEMLGAVRAAVGSHGSVYDQTTHAVVLWHELNPPEELLERLSRDLETRVIWLAFQKQVDAFGYQRWENGTRLRRLVYGCYDQERTWEQVDGEPEPWEGAAIFDVLGLEGRIASLRQLGKDSRLIPEEEESLRQIWRERRLDVGSVEPAIEGRDVAEAVALAYRLPGWTEGTQPG